MGMKHGILFLVLMSAVFAVGGALAKVREFTTKEGTSIHGEILEYDQKTDSVKFRTDQGKTVQTRAATFLDEDFIYIRDWDAVQRFRENTNFRIYLNDAASENKWTKYSWFCYVGKIEPVHTYTTDFNRMAYEIKFDNQTGYDLENVDIKYCIFYEQERLDHLIEEKVADLMVRPALHHFTIVPDGMNKKFTSSSVVLRRKEIVMNNQFRFLDYLEGEGRFLKSRMVGMIFRATLNTASGPSVMREIRLPKDLPDDYAWVEPTEDNTVWSDDDLDEREDTRKPPTEFEEMGGSDDEDEGE
jgi:hypothetical protein